MEMASPSGDRLLLLGPLRVIQDGAAVLLPRSRKVRALLAYLAMAPRPVTRERLCELFWDVADDPKSELRWCLSKLRPMVDRPTTTRLIAEREQVWIETRSLDVDAASVASNTQKALVSGAPKNLRALLASFRGHFLEGLSVDGAPSFENWLAGQRHRFRQLHQQLLERLSGVLPADARLEVLRELIEVAPFDETVHIELVRTLLSCALYAEAESQIDASIERFQREGIDSTSLKSAFAAAQRSVPKKPAFATCVDVGHLDAATGQHSVRTHRPTILVMPFTAATPADIVNADGITSDIIFGIAKLRSISVIAQGTAFSLRSRSPSAAAALANAEYVAAGHLRRDGRRYLVSIELSDPNNGRSFWADEYGCDIVASYCAPPQLTARIVAGLDTAIRVIERNRALLTPPASLDAWQAYHRGLAHMYRFTTGDNRKAQQLFSNAIALDPTFSQSYAGLSFTHFMNAFLQQTQEREREIALAFETAGQGLEVDPSDPAVHWAMGRALWLRREYAGALSSLDQSVRLSPSFALAHYNLAMVHCQVGDPTRAIEAADIATHLSPLDPMLFAIYGTRTFALLRLGRVEEAAEFALRGGQQPNAHVHAHAIAALTLATAGRLEEARAERRCISKLNPNYNFKQFTGAFQLLDDLTNTYRKAARLVQIPE